jgi:hypothetical protein
MSDVTTRDVVYIQSILHLFRIIKEINNCHECVFNHDDSDQIIKDLNNLADIVYIEPQDRWWNKDAN